MPREERKSVALELEASALCRGGPALGGRLAFGVEKG
jgi:hypothetical protein